MKCGAYVANTIHNILFLEFYLIHPISTAEDPTGYSKYGLGSFLACVADNLHHLYATGYSSCRLGWLGLCSHIGTVISARLLCNPAKLRSGDLGSGSSHIG